MNTPTGAPVPTPKTYQQVMVVENVELIYTRRGIVPGIAGVAVAALLLLINDITADSATELANKLLSGMITSPVTLTYIAVLLGVFGLCFSDSSCMLLGGVALVGAFLVETSAFYGLVPAALMIVSHIQMKDQYMLQVRRVAIEAETKK